ncbi:T9SS type A sorting domain-containing protein [Taibaiella soli]|uniref:Secretion system C-terminal sorting domain-containing protein n=1 Tax=Taibaiella soli TaxID=1649169 RepID=A0A2W2AJX7_9BACT|nr:T9SS type A sorting domain-containing protein [Taibaiella soli]PZF72540.1 hypothetical protein DN068_11795 [Taibaiella soli]
MATAIAVLCAQASKAQMSSYTQTLNATGGTAVVSTDIFEWSVGEMPLVQTFTTSSLMVTQGVLQTDPISTDVNTTAGINDNLHVYPVPASSLLNIQYDFAKSGTLNYELQDITGRKIAGRSLKISSGSQTEQVSMESLASGHYLLHVLYQPTGADKASSVVFKIEKN